MTEDRADGGTLGAEEEAQDQATGSRSGNSGLGGVGGPLGAESRRLCRSRRAFSQVRLLSLFGLLGERGLPPS